MARSAGAARSAGRRVTAVALALAAGLGVVFATVGPVRAESAGSGGAAEFVPRGLERFYHQRLDWRSCVLGPDDAEGAELERAGARCADVTVPLDYGDPRGRTLTVAMSRIRATDPARRAGVLLLNDGGPGGPTLGAPPRVRAAMKDVAGRYDLVGVDPRFAGRSTPLDCGWPVGSALLSAGVDRAGFDRQVSFQKDLAARCRAAAGPLLPHATTRNTARDMDVIRGALGERRISYLGASYGSYLGTVYTQMFPGRYDRVVFDGALDPRTYGPGMFPALLDANERALAEWAAWTAARHGTFGLGRTAQEVVAGLLRTVEAAARTPLTVAAGPEVFRLDDTQVPFVLFSGLSDDTDESRGSTAAAMAVLARAAEGRPTGPLTPDFTELLRFFLTPAGARYGGAQMAILCADGAAPGDPEVHWRAVERSRAEHPLLGPVLNNVLPCTFWDPPRGGRTEVRHDVPALIVAATGDPRTPYRDGVALHGLLPSSRMVTLRGAFRHGLYGLYGNACVDEAVNAYLASGALPRADVTCVKEEPVPVGWSAAGAPNR
ncbi:alpha/beta hydrolase [Kitasatospora sp. NPDC004240]